MNRVTLAALGAALLLSACKKEAPPQLYEPMAVARRDIIVSAEAAGSVEPILVVQVKSRASGQILQMRVETGDFVHRGDTLVMVDRRDPTNTYNQADADLEVARAQLATAEAAKRRSDQMFQTQLISEQDKEQADLAFANARAQLVRAEVNVQNARDQLNDCNVIAPVDGVIIQKNAEVGQVITSAVRDVSGGTVLLQMADLAVVQVRTLVDETDIGKIQPGMRAQITVDAYPNRPFDGTVLKIEPQSTTNQNVTMFPVLIRIGNENGLLRPGMNAEVEIQVAQTHSVLAIPNAALRTNRDVASAAQVLGLNPDAVMATLARADSAAAPNGPTAADGATRQTTLGGSTADGRARPGTTPAPGGGSPAGQFGGAPAGGAAQRQGGPGGFQMPAGFTAEQMRPIFEKFRNGQALSPQEQAMMTRFRAAMASSGGSGQRRRFGSGNSFQFGGTYIVFVLRDGKPVPVRVRTGVTDMDYSEVRSGLTEQDTVLLLPSASLVQSQQDMRDRFQRMTGGGGVPGMKQQVTPPPSSAPAATRPGAGR